MDLFKRMIAVVSINLHRWKRDYRIWLIFVLLLLIGWRSRRVRIEAALDKD